MATVEGFTVDANWDGGHSCLLGIYALGGCDYTEYSDVDITARDNTVFNYGKNGITANCELATATIKGNVVTGRGVLNYPDYAQNGIQLGWEASGTITGNTVRDHYYNNDSWAATGIFYYMT